MMLLARALFCHSGAGRRPEPAIQNLMPCLHPDSGSGPSGRPEMTVLGGDA